MSLTLETKQKVYSVIFAKYGVIVSVLAKVLMMKILLFVLVVMKLTKICEWVGLGNVLLRYKGCLFRIVVCFDSCNTNNCDWPSYGRFCI